jgi:hypothetical protein
MERHGWTAMAMTGNERTMIVIRLQSAGMMAPFGSYQNVSPDLVMGYAEGDDLDERPSWQ